MMLAVIALGAAVAWAQVGVGPHEVGAPHAPAEHPALAPAHGATPDTAGQHTLPGMHGEEAHRQHQVIEFDAATAVWVIVIFIILLMVLYPTAWKGVLRGLEARESRIRKSIADAEQAQQRAEATLREYQQQLASAEAKVRELIGSATIQGEKLAEDIRGKAQQEAEDIRQRTNRDLELAKKQAISEIYEKAADISTSIAAKILQKNINADDQRELVRQSLDQLGNGRN